MIRLIFLYPLPVVVAMFSTTFRETLGISAVILGGWWVVEVICRLFNNFQNEECRKLAAGAVDRRSAELKSLKTEVAQYRAIDRYVDCARVEYQSAKQHFRHNELREQLNLARKEIRRLKARQL